MPNALTKKIGPFPVWAWGIGALVFIGVVYYMRKGMEEPIEPTDSDYGQEPIAAGAGPGGISGGNGSGGGGTIYDPLPPLEPLPSYPPEPVYVIPDPIYEQPFQPYPIQAPEAEPPPDTGQKTTVATPQKQTSFLWGGKTWRKGDLAKFRNYLKGTKGIYKGPKGYALWAKNHPKVVADFGWPRS